MRDSIEISTHDNTFESNKAILLGEIHTQFDQWIKDNPVGLDGTDPNFKTIDLKNTKIRDLFMEYLNFNNNLVHRLVGVFRKSQIQRINGKYEGFGDQIKSIKAYVYNYIVMYKKRSIQLMSLDDLLSDKILSDSQNEVNMILQGGKSTEKKIISIQKLIASLLAKKHHEALREILLPGELVD